MSEYIDRLKVARSKSTLLQVAKSHASSRILSGETREIFQHIVNGETYVSLLDDLEYVVSDVADAFFEAALSCSTRAAQSPQRRVMGNDLRALRDAFLSGESIVPQTYTMTVKVQGDADTMRRALLELNHDAARVVFVSNPTTEA